MASVSLSFARLLAFFGRQDSDRAVAMTTRSFVS